MAATVARRLALIDSTTGDEPLEQALKVAFATSDQKTVNQHFGSAFAFVIYHVTADEARFGEVIVFGEAEKDGNEDKLAPRIAALDGCAAVYCRAVGASAIARLKKAGVQPLKINSGTAIKPQLAALQQELRDDPPVWVLRGLAAARDAGRFDEMEAEGWSE
jgi:nitrogen fixation protein NifX